VKGASSDRGTVDGDGPSGGGGGKDNGGVRSEWVCRTVWSGEKSVE
jgi:hypothetical protein